MGVEEWKGRRDRRVTLPSGFVATVRLPSLLFLVKAGRVPQPLRQMAERTLQKGAPVDASKDLTVEQMEDYRRFCDWLVVELVVSPSLTVEDVAALPEDDRDELVAYAMRWQRLPSADGEEDESVSAGDLASFRGE